jgi:hypothetical protein
MTSLYVAVTRAQQIWRIPLQASGIVAKVGLFAQLHGGMGGPDGIALDAEGCLIVAHTGFGSIWRLSPVAEPVLRVTSCAGFSTTNIAFGGPERRTLFITESHTGSILTAELPAPDSSFTRTQARQKHRGPMSQSHSRRTSLKLLAGAAIGLAAVQPGRAAFQEVPWSSGTEKPRTKAPANATDCHHHIYDHRFPASPTATLLPPDASVADYRKLQERLGITRNVVVQPSTYGTDNRLLIEALAQFGPTARGIVMLDQSVGSDELKRLNDKGVRGVRFGTRLPGGAPMDDRSGSARVSQVVPPWTIWSRSPGRSPTSVGTSARVRGRPHPEWKDVVFFSGALPTQVPSRSLGTCRTRGGSARLRVIADLIESGACVGEAHGHLS